MNANNGSGKNAQVWIGDGPATEMPRPTAAIGTGTTSTGPNSGSLATSSIDGGGATPAKPVGAGINGSGKNAQVSIGDIPAKGRPKATAAGST